MNIMELVRSNITLTIDYAKSGKDFAWSRVVSYGHLDVHYGKYAEKLPEMAKIHQKMVKKWQSSITIKYTFIMVRRIIRMLSMTHPWCEKKPSVFDVPVYET
jgi:hypothetical protein